VHKFNEIAPQQPFQAITMELVIGPGQAPSGETEMCVSAGRNVSGFSGRAEVTVADLDAGSRHVGTNNSRPPGDAERGCQRIAFGRDDMPVDLTRRRQKTDRHGKALRSAATTTSRFRLRHSAVPQSRITSAGSMGAFVILARWQERRAGSEPAGGAIGQRVAGRFSADAAFPSFMGSAAVRRSLLKV